MGRELAFSRVADQHAGLPAAHQPCRGQARRQVRRRRRGPTGRTVRGVRPDLVGLGWQSAVAGAAGSTTTGDTRVHARILLWLNLDHLAIGLLHLDLDDGPSGGASATSHPRRPRSTPPRLRWPSSRARSPRSRTSLDQADEQYNQSVVDLTSTRSSLQATQASSTRHQDTSSSPSAPSFATTPSRPTSTTPHPTRWPQIFAAPTTGPRSVTSTRRWARATSPRRGQGAGRPAEAVRHPDQTPGRTTGGDGPARRRGPGPPDGRRRPAPSPRPPSTR